MSLKGRTKLTPAMHTVIVASFKRGGTQTMAAGAARIGQSTLSDWIVAGRREWEAWNAGELDELTDRARLALDIDEACAGVFLEAIEIVREGKQGWQSSSWVLERRLPTEFAITDRVVTKRLEITGDGGGPVKLEGGSALGDALAIIKAAGALPETIDGEAVEAGDEVGAATARRALPAARDVLAEPAEGEPSADSVPAD